MQLIEKKIKFYTSISPQSIQQDIVLSRLKSGRQSYLIACMPKTGSTWISNILNALPGFQKAAFGVEDVIEPVQIERAMRLFEGKNIFHKQTIQYNQNTHNCIIQFCIHPIVLFRDIRDNILSLVEYWKRYDNSNIPQPFVYAKKEYFHDDYSSCIFSDCCCMFL